MQVKKIGLCGLILGMALAAGMVGESLSAQAQLKVHKKQVMISAPDENGSVLVRGMAGAIERSGPTVLAIAVQKSHPAVMNEDGSFGMKVAAEAGDRIIITASNEAGKRSVGTFKVPASEAGAGAEEKAQSEPEEEGGVIVIIKVVDKKTRETLSEKKIEVPTDKLAEAPEKAGRFAKDLATKCASYAKKRLRSLSETVKEKTSGE